MEKAKFNNITFYWCLISILGVYFILNLTKLIITGSLLLLVTLMEGLLLIILIVTNHKYSRIALIICSILFFIIAPCLQLLGRTINDSLDSFVNFDLTYYLKALVTLAIGIMIYSYSKNTIVIEKQTTT